MEKLLCNFLILFCKTLRQFRTNLEQYGITLDVFNFKKATTTCNVNHADDSAVVQLLILNLLILLKLGQHKFIWSLGTKIIIHSTLQQNIT